jgi:hypothetical protein
LNSLVKRFVSANLNKLLEDKDVNLGVFHVENQIAWANLLYTGTLCA